MDLHTEILKHNSKEQNRQIADWVAKDKQRLSELLQLFFHGDYTTTQRSAWILSLVNDTEPRLLFPHLSRVIERMNEPGVHSGVKRHVVSILERIEIPASLHGQAMNVCFDFLADPNEAVAVQCSSMSVLHKLSKHYPELRQELITIIEDRLAHGKPTAAYLARARKVMKGR